MTSWIVEALSEDNLKQAKLQASRHILNMAWGFKFNASEYINISFIADTLELAVIDLLDDEQKINELRQISSDAFFLMRAIPRPSSPIEDSKLCLRLACLGVLGDRGIEASRFLKENPWQKLPILSSDWGDRTISTILDVWLRLIRKDGWEDLNKIYENIENLRKSQSDFEATYLQNKERTARTSAWELVALYHLARAAELLALYTTQGQVDGHFDIRQQIDSQMDSALIACSRAELIELDSLIRLISGASYQLISNSIWTITRAVNSRVTKFVDSLVKGPRPIFEVLPPQRRTLREKGLLGSSHRSVIVSLPTSSGKTFIAEFRILQALNQFDHEQGWVAYLVPTRALVNQICTRLRRDFSPLNVMVERVSPALEVDSLEAKILTNDDKDSLFRVLVTTPEKLDLMLRSGWEEKIGRPLTLVVVDEAHNIAQKDRGIKLELLLATINRDCRFSQFLLLTPFIDNGRDIARWLSPDSHDDISLEVDWQPNDRVIALSVPKKGIRPGDYSVELNTVVTSKNTITVPEKLSLGDGRILGFSWSDVNNNSSNLAAATAQVLKGHGPIIVLTQRPDWAWSLAKKFEREENKISLDDDLILVRDFLIEEFGESFDLCKMLEFGVGVHHSGLSDEVKRLIEWLFEKEKLRVLVATTTIAQGVNFPVSGVVMAQNKYYDQDEGLIDMPPEDFWNLAGRVGRVDQSSVGVVALAAIDEQKAKELEEFINRQVLSLNSSLIYMLEKAYSQWGDELDLRRLFIQPEWSAFLQYLAHTYRQIGDPYRFATQVEQILRGTLGFDALRRKNINLARLLIRSVRSYGEHISGKNLKLVDSVGFSWESISVTLGKISEEKITGDVWNPETLFRGNVRDLKKMMGILLEVPELRENLREMLGGTRKDGNTLALIVRDWVNGASLPDISKEYFAKSNTGENVDTTQALSDCCRNIYGKLIQTVSWGLSAIQTMTVGDKIERMSESQQQTIRNLPARVYYGVNSDEAIALRLLGVPRSAASQIAISLEKTIFDSPLPDIRQLISNPTSMVWEKALGKQKGENYYSVWKILEGL